MFELDYYISTKKETIIFLEEDLRYGFLLGGIQFKTNTAKIDMQWDWIPLLDFAYSMFIIVRDSQKLETFESFFEFTESSESLTFFKSGKFIKIVPSFSNDTLEVLFEQFNLAISKFYAQILEMAKKELNDKKISLDLLKPFDII